jgi:hypothetical protein
MNEVQSFSEPKVLTVARVTEIIATTRAPEGQSSADEQIVARIDALCKGGYTLEPAAAEQVAKYRRSARTPGARS